MEKLTEPIVRREFIKKVGFGSVALASLPSLGPGLALARGIGKSSVNNGNPTITNWIFAAFSAAAVIDNVAHRAAMEGHGFVQNGAEVEGVGSYTLFDNNAPVPKTVLGAGTWQATSLNSITLIPSWGSFQAGIVDMQINLNQVVPSPATFTAELVVPCNIPNAGLFTSLEEGFYLTITGAAEGTYSPLSPAIGGSVVMVFTEPELDDMNSTAQSRNQGRGSTSAPHILHRTDTCE